MNAIPEKQNASDKRVCDRFGINRTVKVTFPDERVLSGSTVNISLGGVLVKTTQPNDDMLLGQMAQMYLLSSEGHASDAYDCKVVRVTPDLIGLEIDKKNSAKLGKELTRGVFTRRCRGA